MKPLKSWMRNNPKKMASLFTATIIFGLITILFADLIYLAQGIPFDWLLIAYHGIVLACIPLFWFGAARLRKPLSVILALSLLSVPTARADEPQPLIAWCVVGVVAVLVAGAIVACRAKNIGNRIVNGRTNAWPDEFHTATHSCGAVFSEAVYGPCPTERGAPSEPVAFTLTVAVHSATNATTTIRVDTGKQYVQTVPEFQEELAAQGLAVVGGPGRFESFAHDGQPALASQVPITFDWTTGTVSVNGGGVLVTVEASSDLLTWTQTMQINVEPGTILKVGDATDSGLRFYKVSLDAKKAVQ